MRCDELSHSSERLYRWKVRWIMASLHWLAELTPYHDPKAGHAYNSQLHDICSRYLKDSTVLDVGCGPGEQSTGFVKEYRARRCVGVDNSRGMVTAARNDAANVAFVQSTALHLPFSDGSFDVVHSRAMFHHIAPDSRVNALREQLRVARHWVVLEDVTGLPPGLLWYCIGSTTRRWTAPTTDTARPSGANWWRDPVRS